MGKLLTDVRGVNIEINDTVCVAYTDYDKGGAGQEIAVVKGINILTNEIILDDGEPIPVDKFEVVVLPDHYKDW